MNNIILVKAKRNLFKPNGGPFTWNNKFYKLEYLAHKYYKYQFRVRNMSGKITGYWTSQEAPEVDKDFNNLFRIICQGEADEKRICA